MRFDSERDAWLSIIIWSTVPITIAAGAAVLMAGPPGQLWLLLVISLSFLLPVFPVWFWLATYYVLTENRLIINHGPLRKSIPLAEIRSVKKTSNPLAGPALSLKRLEIAYGKHDSILISPRDQDEFIRILKERCPRMMACQEDELPS